jgi:hypothetical protein
MIEKKIHHTIMTLIIDFIHSVLTTSYTNWVIVLCLLLTCTHYNIWIIIAVFNTIALLGCKYSVVTLGLQNTLSFIHPIIVLLFYNWVFTHILVTRPVDLRNNLIFITILSLVLGGWWAFQEFTWGGWWNWDSVESPVLLLILLVVSMRFHVKQVRLSLFNLSSWFWNVAISSLLIIYFIRYSTTLSVHAFTSLEGCYSIYYGLHFWIKCSFATLSTLTISNSFNSIQFIKLYTVVVFTMYLHITITKLKHVYFAGPKAAHYTLIALTILILNYNLNLYYISQIRSGTKLTFNWFILNQFGWIKPVTSALHSNLHALTRLVN